MPNGFFRPTSFLLPGSLFGQGDQGGFWRSDPLAANWENLPLDVGPNDFIRVYNETGLLFYQH